MADCPVTGRIRWQFDSAFRETLSLSLNGTEFALPDEQTVLDKSGQARGHV